MTQTGFWEDGDRTFGREEGRERGFSTLMSIKKKRTRFTEKVRIDPKQLQWLRENKDTYTMAGFLDKIINEYKS